MHKAIKKHDQGHIFQKLLVQDRTKRIGNLKNGTEDVKRHRWFKSVDWDDVFARKLKPPIVPRIRHDGDPGNFDNYPEDDWSWRQLPPLSERELRMFEDFWNSKLTLSLFW